MYEASIAEVAEQAQHQRGGQRMNALKHGLRSRSGLLPGEDVAAFDALHRSLIAAYRPLTPLEERCVERIARCEWRMGRWQRWEEAMNGTLDRLVEDGPEGDVAQRYEPDLHYWQHRSVDCTLQERRLEKSMLRTEQRLLELQRLRRHRLLADAPAPRIATREASPLAAVAEVAAAPQRASATHCSATGNPIVDQQKEREMGRGVMTREPAAEPWPPRWTPAFAPTLVDSVAPMSMLPSGEAAPRMRG